MADSQKYQADLDRLMKLGHDIAGTLAESGKRAAPGPDVATEYQQWYTESSRFIKQVLPERLDEFVAAYSPSHIYRLKDYPEDDEYYYLDYSQDLEAILLKLRLQNDLMQSAKAVFTSSLFDIAAVVQADLFDSELDAARELRGKGFLRPSGVVAGVVLERHLAQVTANHNHTMRKKSPTINDYNELLKREGVVDVPAWRQIQRLADLRNLCAHNKEREPTKEEVGELIEGADKYTKTLF